MVNSKNIYFFLGSALSQVFALLTSFYILRYASPEIYGNFSYFVALGSIVGSIATLKYEQSIAISIDIHDTEQKFGLTLQTCFIFSLTFLFIYAFIDPKIGLENLALAFMLANSIALNASLQQLFLFQERHKFNGLLSLVYAALNFVLILFLLKSKGGLKLSYTLSFFISAAFFLVWVMRDGFKLKLYSYKKYWEMVKQYKMYPLYILPGAISTILLTYGHPLLIKYMFSEHELGLFSLTLRILVLPSTLVGAVVSGLFRARISKFYLTGQTSAIRQESIKVVKLLAITSLIGYPVLLIILKNLHLVIKIKGWEEIGSVSFLMVFYAISQYIYQPLSNIALVCDEGKLLMALNMGQLAATFLVYVTAYFFKVSFSHFLVLLSAILMIYSLFSSYKFLSIKKEVAV